MGNRRASRLAICGLWLLAVGCREDSTNALIEQLGDSDPRVRRAAIDALADEPGDVAVTVPALARVLADTDTSVRLSAAVALQKIDAGNPSFPPVLIESLEAGHAPMFLEVGRMGRDAEWAVPTLLKLLSHPQPQIRGLAARALGEIGIADTSVTAALERRQRDEAPAVRRAAERALELIATPPMEEMR